MEQEQKRPRGRPSTADPSRRNEFGARLFEIIGYRNLRRREIEDGAGLRAGQLSDYINGYARPGAMVGGRIIEAMPIPEDEKQMLYRAGARLSGWRLTPEPWPGDHSI